MIDDDRPDACESCEWETVELKAYKLRPGRDALWLCRVCAGTVAGNAAAYPEHYPNSDVLALTAWGINYLQREIRQARAPAPVPAEGMQL